MKLTSEGSSLRRVVDERKIQHRNMGEDEVLLEVPDLPGEYSARRFPLHCGAGIRLQDR